jgi:hypothetical protein
MKQVLEFPELYELLKINELGFMDTWFYVCSEDSNVDFQFIQAFENLDLGKELRSELNEEQSLYCVNSSIYIIKGMVTILLIKN